MAISNGWLDWPERQSGPVDKVYTQGNSSEGIAHHSMEGFGYAGIEYRMNSNAKNPDGTYTDYAQASWMFSNMVDGTFIQHYPVAAAPWASGNATANTKLWSVESEGKAGTPLNEKQKANMLRLYSEFEAFTKKKATRSGTSKNLWEHNEVWNWATRNAGPTACPSNRYDAVYAAWEQQGEAVVDARVDKLIAALGGLAAIDAWNAGGNSLLAGYAKEQQKLGVTAYSLEKLMEQVARQGEAIAAIQAAASKPDHELRAALKKAMATL